MVIVGMGGSNLAAAAILHASEENPEKQIFLLDTTDPDALPGSTRNSRWNERCLFSPANRGNASKHTHCCCIFWTG